jgi:hypothetical protein
MPVHPGAEVAALQRLTMPELRARYAEVFGEATRASNRAWLVKRLAWRLQALAEGDLSERARRRAAELARAADLRLTPPREMTAPATQEPGASPAVPAPRDPRLPPAGSVLARPYKGRLLQVQVLEGASPTTAAPTPRSAPWPRPPPAPTATASSSSDSTPKEQPDE